jgi:spore germination cell wall hydrolase CwlJ-like protein
MVSFTGAEIFHFGIAISQFGQGMTDDVLAALSWVFVHRKLAGQLPEALGPVECANVSGANGNFHAKLSPDTAHAISICASVIAGDILDPVMGATRFHNHYETPSWADKMDLCAIIGPYLFYRPHLAD